MNKLLICAAAALIFTGCSTSQPVDETDISKPVAGDASKSGEEGKRRARGDRRGGETPQLAIDACAGQTAGASCGFTTPRGDRVGVCSVLPTDETRLVCRPERSGRSGRSGRQSGR